MPKILVAPTAFKGTLSPKAVAKSLCDGIYSNSGYSKDFELLSVPLADGGDGTIESVNVGAGGTIHLKRVQVYKGLDVEAQWLDLGCEAMVELASACGIARMPTKQPLLASTAALGAMIETVFDYGFRDIKIAIGGSASTDGGAGALNHLGARFFDALNNRVIDVNGETIGSVRRCDLSALARFRDHANLYVLTDVSNPLCGVDGAAAVYAPQKGADDAQVSRLEANLSNFADVLEDATGLKLRNSEGMGAAGGTAFGLACALGASVLPGFEWVSKKCSLESKIADCALVLTGEGRFDEQSTQGKVIGELIKLCRRYGKKLWIVAADSNFRLSCLPDGVDNLIICHGSQGICSSSDLTYSLKSDLDLHDFFTSGA